MSAFSMLLYKVTYNVYSDSYVTLVHTYQSSIGITKWTGAEVPWTRIDDQHYNAFVNETHNDIFRKEYSNTGGTDLSLWFPGVNGENLSAYAYGYYWETIFANGYKVRPSGPVVSTGGSAEPVYIYDENDNLLYTTTGITGRERFMFAPPAGLDSVGNGVLLGILNDNISNSKPLGNWGVYGTGFPYIQGSRLERGIMRGCSVGMSGLLTALFIDGDLKPDADSTKTDPFNPGGESTTGGGTGDFDGTSDPIDFPSLPSISAVDAGFITLFNPSASQLRALASYMWSNSLFDLDTWKKIFADPMDAILGLTIVPVDVPSSGTASVKVGNISTDVTMTCASTQYVEVDCGSINVNEYWGAYLDYEPFTRAEIYLPYIGTHAISVDDIMGKEVHVKYHIDILSGACAAYVKCGDSVLYTFIGQCASSIPITGSDMTNVINGVISAAVSIGSMVATGGASAPVAAPALANTAVNHMKPNVEKSGSMAGTGGLLAIQTPYLILTRPRQCLPAYQNEYMGYPSFISRMLSEVSGYTEVEQVHLDGIAATEAEITEIENLLKSGVIL